MSIFDWLKPKEIRLEKKAERELKEVLSLYGFELKLILHVHEELKKLAPQISQLDAASQQAVNSIQAKLSKILALMHRINRFLQKTSPRNKNLSIEEEFELLKNLSEKKNLTEADIQWLRGVKKDFDSLSEQIKSDFLAIEGLLGDLAKKEGRLLQKTAPQVHSVLHIDDMQRTNKNNVKIVGALERDFDRAENAVEVTLSKAEEAEKKEVQRGMREEFGLDIPLRTKSAVKHWEMQVKRSRFNRYHNAMEKARLREAGFKARSENIRRKNLEQARASLKPGEKLIELRDSSDHAHKSLQYKVYNPKEEVVRTVSVGPGGTVEKQSKAGVASAAKKLKELKELKEKKKAA